MHGKAFTAYVIYAVWNSVYTKWVPRPLTAIIIVSISDGRHIDLRSSNRSSIIDLRSSIFDHRPSIFDHRSSVFDLRSSIIDLRPSIFEGRHIDLRINIRPSIFASIFDHRSSTIDLRPSTHRPSILHIHATRERKLASPYLATIRY